MLTNYSWGNPEQTVLNAINEEGGFVSMTTQSHHYAEFLASGAEAAPYVAPPEPEPLTAQQKLENAGLTVDELKTLLGI